MVNPNNRFLNDPEETMRVILDARQVTMWTAIPGIVQSVNLTNVPVGLNQPMTCVVQPALSEIVVNQNGVQKVIQLPLLLDVPIVFPSAGGFTMTLPMAANDEVLVVFSSRMIDSWWQSGKVSLAMEARMHDLSDGFAIPGPKSLPNVLPSISTTKLQIRNNAGTVYLGVGSKFSMANAATDLSTVLNNLVTALTTFSTGLTTVNLSANAAALATTLATVTTELAALLEVGP
jgi:hypothetical protein